VLKIVYKQPPIGQYPISRILQVFQLSFTSESAHCASVVCSTRITPSQGKMDKIKVVEDFVLFHIGSRVLVSGASSSGKSFFIKELIKKRQNFFEITPNRIIFCTHLDSKDVYKDELLALKNDRGEQLVHFQIGVPSEEEILEPYTLIIFDDLLTSSDSNAYLSQILCYFTIKSHHLMLYSFITTQSLFRNSNIFREITSNCDYLVQLRSPRALNQLRSLASQILPPGQARLLVDVYRKVTKNSKYPHIVFSFHAQTPDILRILSNLFKENERPITVHILPDIV
jgi:hypothetical protein